MCRHKNKETMTHSHDKIRTICKRALHCHAHVFAIASVVYTLTLAPSATLWDASEFICSGAALNVGHPPGAPFFWLLLRLFTLFAPASHAALMCNIACALLSALAAAVLAATTSEIIKWAAPDADAVAETVASTTAGLFFALADSVWAVSNETEVYGCATLIGLSTLWLCLRWRRKRDGKLLAAAAYMAGLGGGIHWLSWLCLPTAASRTDDGRACWQERHVAAP